jgi:sugar-specific transcriptional regulator TrmB
VLARNLSLTDKARAALEGLGLTGTEVKAYVALLEKGAMTASEISSAARIPYSKVYESLGTLHQKGWIEEQRSRPVLFTAKPPEAALDEHRTKSDSERREREQLALKELTGIYQTRDRPERPEIWILRGANEIIARVKSALLNCRSELMIALPLQAMPFTSEMHPLLTTLREKGVRSLILTSSEAQVEATGELSKVAEVRSRETMYGGGVIVDAKEVVLLLAGGDSPTSTLAIWADHPGLATFAKDYFEFLWNSPETARMKEVRQ